MRHFFSFFTTTLFTSVLFLGCDSNPASESDASLNLVDASLNSDASLNLADASLNLADASPWPDATPENRILVIQDPYRSRSLAAIHLPDGTVELDAVENVLAESGTATLRQVGELLLVINTLDENAEISIIDRDLQIVGRYSNIAMDNMLEDATLVDGVLYMVQYRSPKIVVLDTNTGIPSTIDLSSYDSDGDPNCHSIYAVGQQLYISCSMWDASFLGEKAGAKGKVLVIDASSHMVTHELEMNSYDPQGYLEQANNGDLYVGTISGEVENNGPDHQGACIERISIGPNPSIGQCAVTYDETYPSRRIAIQLGVYPGGLLVQEDYQIDYGTSYLRVASMKLGGDIASTPLPELDSIFDTLHFSVCSTGHVSFSNRDGTIVYNEAGQAITPLLDLGPIAYFGIYSPTICF